MMKNFNQWMNEYGEGHQHPFNQRIHKVCVPAILFTVIGILWILPRAEVPGFDLQINWAILFILSCLGFYLTLSFAMFLGMAIQMALMGLICKALEDTGLLLPGCLGIFVMAWIGQFWGHKVEGRKPSFFQDMTFLLIGPLWVTRFLYRKLGINV